MPIGNLPARVVSSSAQKIKTIAPSPLQYQNKLDDLFENFKLKGLNHAVIPFAYDGTSWLAATRGNSTIRTGSLNNEFAPWTMLLYVMRDMPDFIFEEQLDMVVDEHLFNSKKVRLNRLLDRLQDATENNRRRLDQDDVLFAASVWYMLSGAADWTKGLILDGHRFKNEFVGSVTGQNGVSLGRNVKMFDDIAQRLDGAFFADLDAGTHATRLISDNEGAYCADDTLWIVMPEPSDFDSAANLVQNYLPIVAKRGGKFAVMLPDTHVHAFDGLGITTEQMIVWNNTTPRKYGIDLYSVDDIPGYRLVTNLELA